MKKCSKIGEQISLYIDGMLETEEVRDVEEHLKACADCRREFEEIRNLVLECREMEEKEPPEYLVPVIMSNIRKEVKSKSGKAALYEWFKNRKVVSIAAAALLLLVVTRGIIPVIKGDFAGLKTKGEISMQSAESPADEQYYEMKKEALNEAMAPEGRGAGTEAEFDSAAVGDSEKVKISGDVYPATIAEAQLQKDSDARKIIKNADLSMDVENFDESFRAIQQMVDRAGGFIQNSNSYVSRSNVGEDGREYKEGHVAMRIPNNEFNRVIAEIEKLGKVTNRSVFGNDVTKQYMDTEARLKSKKVQEERLLDILSKASKVEDILKIENELNRVRTEIEIYTSQLRDWDNLVEYSTINVFMREVEPKDKQVNPPKVGSLWDRVKRGFIVTTNWMIDIVETLIVGVGYALPVIIMAGLGYFVWTRYRNSKSM